MTSTPNQSNFYRGIYEFEDPSGVLLAAKVPAVGTVDLYDGTAIVVKPNQCALFIYNGQVADVFLAGTHRIKTDNVPILTKLANWKFGFESPLRCELIFVAGHAMTGRRWGSPQPILLNLDGLGSVPIRTFGNFNVTITDPKEFFMTIVGTRSALTVTDLEELIQGQIVELLPEAFAQVKTLDELGRSYNELSKRLETMLNKEISQFGIAVQKIQILSALPSKEVIEALDAKTAIQVLGSQKEYLLYKAANSLGAGQDSKSNDSMQMMMGLMLGKGLMGADYHEKEEKISLPLQKASCSACGAPLDSEARFCSKCGGKRS